MPKPAPPEEILEPDLAICDPHHHLMDFPTQQYMLPDYAADLAEVPGVQSTVFLECSAFYSAHGPEHLRMAGETAFAAGVAAMADSGRYTSARVCAGISSRADLKQGAAVVAPLLEAHIQAGNGRFRGVRDVAAWHPSPDVRVSHTKPPPHAYENPDFRDGFAQLSKYGLSFDSWQYHHQLPELAALARAFPETPIMMDHVGGPLGIGPYAGRRDETFAEWAAGVREVASCPNVQVKLGGLGMNICGFGFHKREQLPSSQELADAWRPYLETCIEAFGVDRAMFESNFPVDGVSCSYGNLWNAFKRVAAGYTPQEKAKLFQDNAVRFYKLDLD